MTVQELIEYLQGIENKEMPALIKRVDVQNLNYGYNTLGVENLCVEKVTGSRKFMSSLTKTPEEKPCFCIEVLV